jgi:site-specific recombinase XerD
MDSLELLGVWHTWLESGYAPDTVEGYFGAVLRFVKVNRVPLVLVTGAMVDAWIASFPFRSSRRVTYFHALRSLFSWMVREGHIDKDPTSGIRIPSPEEKEPRSLSRAEYQAVRDAAFQRFPVRGYAIELLYYTGGRVGEVTDLTWDRVTSQGIIFARTKSGKERTIPWSPGLRRAVDGLRSYFGERERVLPRAEQTVWQWCRDAGDAAGVPRVHPHLLRSTFATTAEREGAKLVVVAKLMGHAKVTTTQRYRAIDQSELAEAVLKL